MSFAEAKAYVVRHMGSLVLLLMLVVLTGGCDFLTSALPPTPTPFPTLARLPTVTPEPPTPTPFPTATPTVSQPTPTPVQLESVVIIGANFRTGPGLDYDVIEVLPQGTIVTIQTRNDEWYKVKTEDGVMGWLAGEVLDITLEDATAVPTIEE